jgi:hypothetical protein
LRYGLDGIDVSCGCDCDGLMVGDDVRFIYHAKCIEILLYCSAAVCDGPSALAAQRLSVSKDGVLPGNGQGLSTCIVQGRARIWRGFDLSREVRSVY